MYDVTCNVVVGFFFKECHLHILQSKCPVYVIVNTDGLAVVKFKSVECLKQKHLFSPHWISNYLHHGIEWYWTVPDQTS